MFAQFHLYAIIALIIAVVVNWWRLVHLSPRLIG